MFNSSGVVSETFAIYRRNLAALFSVFLIWGVGVAGTTYAATTWFLGRPDSSIGILPTAYRAMDLGEAWTVVFAVILVSLVATVAGAALVGGVALLTVEQRRGGETTFIEAMTRGIRRYGQILAGSLIAVFLPTVMLALAFLIFSVVLAQPQGLFLAVGLVALTSVFSVGVLLAVSLVLYAPIIMIENERSVGSLRKSWALTKGRRGVILGTLFLLAIAQMIVRLATSVPAVLSGSPLIELALRAVFEGITASWNFIAAGVIYSWIVDPRRPA